MSTAPAIMLAVGGITFANEWLQTSSPTDPIGKPNWKVVPATALAMIAVGLLEKFSPALGIGLAVIALITELTVSFGGRKSPLAELLSVLGAPNPGLK